MMVTGYNRTAPGLLMPTRSSEDLFAGEWQLLQQLATVPRVLVRDGEYPIGRWRVRAPELTEHCQGFRGTIWAKVLVCKIRDPLLTG